MIGHWTVFPEYVALGSLGAAALEWIKKYELSNKLEKEKYKAVTKSLKYWGKFVLFVFASGFVAWAMNGRIPKKSDLTSFIIYLFILFRNQKKSVRKSFFSCLYI